MDNVVAFIKNNKFNIAVLFIYLIFTIVLMFHHEIWRDEAQAWCIVRDLKFFDIYTMSRIEGHPIFWYLLIMPFAKLGFSVIVMQIISLFLVFSAVTILLIKSPFSKFQMLIIPFSAGMVYYLPIIARNYCLIPFILFLIAVFWKNRTKNPYLTAILIILLSQTHIYMLGCAIGLFIIFGYEQILEFIKTRKISVLFPICLIVLSFLIEFFVFYNAIKMNYALETKINNFTSFPKLFLFICQIFIYDIADFLSPLRKFFNIESIIAFLPAFILISYRIFINDKKIFIAYTLSMLYIFGVFYYVYLNGIIYQKVFLILLLIIFFSWLVLENKKDKLLCIAFNILFIISCIVSPLVVTSEIKYNFSGGKQVADYIKNNLNEEDTFISFGNPYLYSPISAYLPDKKLYNVISNSYISYYSFLSQKQSNQEHIPEGKQYFIIQNNIGELEEMGFEVLFSSDKENISSKTEQEIFKICRRDI